MRKYSFPGSFLLHPVFIVSMIAILINNLWFKASRILPLLAGKITDVAIMIYLPALICLGVVFVRHTAQSLKSLIKKNPRRHPDKDHIPSHAIIVISIAISAMLMIVIRASDIGVRIYAVTVGYLNLVLFNGRIITKPVKDATDLVSLFFLLIPYIILKRAIKKRGLTPPHQTISGFRVSV